MPFAAVPFTHFDITAKEGDEFPDDHELVILAPHLFTKKKRPASSSATPKSKNKE